ncbi:carbamoyltransferase HypF [Oscillochloris sp. ZM17-4]|nr:carbamoyltransferase HypF [Oscillochloris sp. ZM17-4]
MTEPPPAGLDVLVRGAVQGVGFRPFVYRLAQEIGLDGWVLNGTGGVSIELDGPPAGLELFLRRLRDEAPPRALIVDLEAAWRAPHGHRGFHIRLSDGGGPRTTLILPDTATCPECLAETLDQDNRRFGYAFTNCTNCGPRFSIITALPYDRPNTTMRGFALCPACLAEYEHPADRRFHAQPNACPVCGPRLEYRGLGVGGWGLGVGSANPQRTPTPHIPAPSSPLAMAASALRQGQIVAVKGLGGYQLMVDPRSAEAVARLRDRKARPEKPLALIARDLAQAAEIVQVDDAAAALLSSAEAPIVLLPRRADGAFPIAPEVAPGSPYLGVMLPCAPLHHLLLRAIDFPLVATSGNLSDEPICIGEEDAARRLGQIADAFLAHDRPIARHIDDSVATFMAGAPRLLRRARGYAPLPVALPAEAPCILAVGPQLKNTVALSVGRQAFISQHIGDLSTMEAVSAFERVIADFLRLYEARPEIVAHDLHPDYVSSHFARRASLAPGARRVAVQHHHAHFAACLAEHHAAGPALGVIWDGTGYGVGGTIWGGEFLLGDASGSRRVAYLRPFRLPGGDAAVREPARVAVALLMEIFGKGIFEQDHLAPVAHFDQTQRGILERMIFQGINSPLTSSAGRLFDGVAALLGLRQRVSFEGQAAIALEHLADPGERAAYAFDIHYAQVPAPPAPAGGVSCVAEPLIVDWASAIVALLNDMKRGVEPARAAARFHNGAIAAITEVAGLLGVEQIALSGGCFQNRLLAEGAIAQLGAAGRRALLPRLVPANDGGVSFGQVAAAQAMADCPTGKIAV